MADVKIRTSSNHAMLQQRRVAEWAARMNLREQENLLDLICVHQSDSGNDLTTVADRLGISEDQAVQVLSGKVDLTLTELRQLAIACDVVISYDVQSSRTALRERLTSIMASKVLNERDPDENWDSRPVSSAARHYFIERAAR